MERPPLIELLGSALELMHPSFVPDDGGRSARLEFYHQFRKLWDRGIPVGLGLGHILARAEGVDMITIRRIAEQATPAANLALLAFATPVDQEQVATMLRSAPGDYEHRLVVVRESAPHSTGRSGLCLHRVAGYVIWQLDA